MSCWSVALLEQGQGWALAWPREAGHPQLHLGQVNTACPPLAETNIRKKRSWVPAGTVQGLPYHQRPPGGRGGLLQGGELPPGHPQTCSSTTSGLPARCARPEPGGRDAVAQAGAFPSVQAAQGPSALLVGGGRPAPTLQQVPGTPGSHPEPTQARHERVATAELRPGRWRPPSSGPRSRSPPPGDLGDVWGHAQCHWGAPGLEWWDRGGTREGPARIQALGLPGPCSSAVACGREWPP